MRMKSALYLEYANEITVAITAVFSARLLGNIISLSPKTKLACKPTVFSANENVSRANERCAFKSSQSTFALGAGWDRPYVPKLPLLFISTWSIFDAWKNKPFCTIAAK